MARYCKNGCGQTANLVTGLCATCAQGPVPASSAPSTPVVSEAVVAPNFLNPRMLACFGGVVAMTVVLLLGLSRLAKPGFASLDGPHMIASHIRGSSQDHPHWVGDILRVTVADPSKANGASMVDFTFDQAGSVKNLVYPDLFDNPDTNQGFQADVTHQQKTDYSLHGRPMMQLDRITGQCKTLAAAKPWKIEAYDPVFSGDGTMVLFRDPVGQGGKVYLYADGSQVAAVEGNDFSWISNGHKLALSRQDPDGKNQHCVAVAFTATTHHKWIAKEANLSDPFTTS